MATWFSWQIFPTPIRKLLSGQRYADRLIIALKNQPRPMVEPYSDSTPKLYCLRMGHGRSGTSAWKIITRYSCTDTKESKEYQDSLISVQDSFRASIEALAFVCRLPANYLSLHPCWTVQTILMIHSPSRKCMQQNRKLAESARPFSARKIRVNFLTCFSKYYL